MRLRLIAAMTEQVARLRPGGLPPAHPKSESPSAALEVSLRSILPINHLAQTPPICGTAVSLKSFPGRVFYWAPAVGGPAAEGSGRLRPQL